LTIAACRIGPTDELLQSLLQSFCPDLSLLKAAEHVRVIYPSEDYVLTECFDGEYLAESLRLSSEEFQRSQFLKETMCEYRAEGLANQRLISNIAMMLLTDEDLAIDDDAVVYLGSNALSRPAWGVVRAKSHELYLDNTELGFLFPALEGSAGLKLQIAEALPFALFSLEPYSAGNIRPYFSDSSPAP